MAQKSILEQALLQVKTLEDAVKGNAKGILASTMKQELNDLLKEEEEEEKTPDEDEKDVEGEKPEDDDDTSISDKLSTDDETPADNEELPAVKDDDELEDEPEKPEEEFPSEDEDSDDTLDMTGASEDEVLKVFKAMKPEDGIVVKKDGDTVEFSDEGNEYIIKLNDEEVARRRF